MTQVVATRVVRAQPVVPPSPEVGATPTEDDSDANVLLKQVVKMHQVKEGFRKMSEQQKSDLAAKDTELAFKNTAIATKDSELASKESEIATLKGVLQEAVEAFEKEKKELNGKIQAQPKSKGKMPVAVPVVPVHSTRQAVLSLIADITRQFFNKADSEEAKVTRAKKRQKKAASPAPTMVYSFRFFDNQWVTIQDETMIGELTHLVDKSHNKVTYHLNGNSYEAELSPTADPQAAAGETTIKQTNTNHPNHTVRYLISSAAPVAAPPPPAQPPKLPVEDGLMAAAKTLLYNAPWIDLKPDAMKTWYDMADGNDSIWEESSSELAALVARWSHFASNFDYCPNQTKLRINPRQFKLWLEIAMARGLHRIRLVMHGSTHYASMKQDPMYYDPAWNNPNCAKGAALYVSTSDHIPRDYNSGSGQPDGSGLVGLLLTVNESSKQPSFGSYENYKLAGSSTAFLALVARWSSCWMGALFALFSAFMYLFVQATS